MLEKKCMKFFKYFFTLKNSGLGSGSVFKTLNPDADPPEILLQFSEVVLHKM